MSAASLLRSSPAFRAAFCSRVVSELGTWFATIALTVAVYDLTGSAAWVSALLLLNVVPAVAVGTFASRFLDRVVRTLAGRLADRAPLGLLYRHALVLAAFGLGVGASARGFAVLLVGAAICGAGNALSLSFADLTLQREIPGERLGQAFGVFQAWATGASVVGMVSAGAFIDAVGGRAAGAVAAAVALVAAGIAAVLAREPRLRPVRLEP